MDANHRHPSKEEVREWMARRRVSSRAGLPLPTPDEIRRELGWHQLPVVQPAAAAPALPVMLAELATVTALVTWCWAIWQLPRERLPVRAPFTP